MVSQWMVNWFTVRIVRLQDKLYDVFFKRKILCVKWQMDISPATEFSYSSIRDK